MRGELNIKSNSNGRPTADELIAQRNLSRNFSSSSSVKTLKFPLLYIYIYVLIP
jgi:hypothetical protein